MTIVTSVKCTSPSVVRAVFTRVTSLPCRLRYTRRFVSKLVEKVSLCASAKLVAGSQVSGSMNILPVEASGMNISPVEAGGVNISPIEAGGMNIPPNCVAQTQLAACRSTRKHAM